MAQSWWWLVGSLVVITVCAFITPRLRLPEVGWAFAVVGLVAAAWTLRTLGAPIWLAQVVCWMLAGIWLVERFGWLPLRQAVVWWAWAQIAFLPLAWMGWSLYGTGWTGTLGQRSILAVWLAVASFWSSGWRAWALATAGVVTGSWMGAPAVLRVVLTRWRSPMALILLIGGALASVAGWWSHLTMRWEVWRSAAAVIPTHWLTGWGLSMLPVGFRESVFGVTIGTRWSPLTDLHSTWLDVLVRGGCLGLMGLLLVIGWACIRSAQTKTLWTWGMAMWTMTWQSAGSQPALMCLGVVWLLSFCKPRRMLV